MARQVKALAAKANDTSSVPGTHIVEEEFYKLSSDVLPHYTHKHTHTPISVILFKKMFCAVDYLEDKQSTV